MSPCKRSHMQITMRIRTIRTVSDLFKQIFHSGATEWSNAQQHLVQDDTHWPPIHCKTWGQVRWEGVGKVNGRWVGQWAHKQSQYNELTNSQTKQTNIEKPCKQRAHKQSNKTNIEEPCTQRAHKQSNKTNKHSRIIYVRRQWAHKQRNETNKQREDPTCYKRALHHSISKYEQHNWQLWLAQRSVSPYGCPKMTSGAM